MSVHGPYRRDPAEPFFWGLFSAGGMTAAMLMPVTILVFGILDPLGLVPATVSSAARLTALGGNWLVKLFLLALLILPLFHVLHRIRFILIDLGLKPLRKPIGVLCYGTAFLGAALAVLVVVRL